MKTTEVTMFTGFGIDSELAKNKNYFNVFKYNLNKLEQKLLQILNELKKKFNKMRHYCYNRNENQSSFRHKD